MRLSAVSARNWYAVVLEEGQCLDEIAGPRLMVPVPSLAVQPTPSARIAGRLQPRVLIDDGLQLDGTANNRINTRAVATFGNPEFDPGHWAIFDAAIEFLQTFLFVFGVQIDEPERSMMPVADGLQNLIVLFAKLFGRRSDEERGTHKEHQAFNLHPIGNFDESSHLLIGSSPGDAIQMTVQIPDQRATSRS